MALSEFTLPMPDNRVVIFGNIVFKLKYKMSPSSENNYTLILQNDLTKLTKGVLRNIARNQRVCPIRSDNMVLFPGVTAWNTGKSLVFKEYGNELAIYPETVLLVVHVIWAQASSACKRPLETIDDQHLPLRKKKMTVEPEQSQNYGQCLKADNDLSVAASSNTLLGTVLGYILKPITKVLKWR